MDRRDDHRRSRGGGVPRFEGNSLQKRSKGSSKFTSLATNDGDDYAKENEITFDTNSSFAWKTSVVPVEMLKVKELRNEMEVRQPPTSVIAKLMGLDMPPTAELMHKQETDSCFPKPSAATRKNSLQLMYQPRRFTAIEQAKDNFEVSESSKYRSKKSIPNYKIFDDLKRPSLEKDFTCENLTGTSDPTDERIGCFRESNQRSEFLDTKRCLSKLDHEHIFVHTEYIGLLSDSANMPKHITVLKPLNPKMLEDSEACRKLESRSEKYNSTRRNMKQSISENRTLHVTKPVVRDYVYPPKFANSVLKQKQEACSVLTRIVVLKPSLEKIEKTDNIYASSISMGNSQISFRKQQDRIGMCKLVSEVQKRQKVPYDVSPDRKRIQSSSELWKENEEISRNNGKDDSLDFTVPKESELFPATFINGKRTQSNPVDSAACMPDHFNDNARRCEDSCYSIDSHVSRQAIRHISKKWIISNKVQNTNGHSNNSSRTLGEMLALSDRENFYKKYMESRRRGNRTLSINNEDSWKNTVAGAVAGCPSHSESSCFTKMRNSVEPINGDRIFENTAESLKHGLTSFGRRSQPSFCSSDSEITTSDTDDMELDSNVDVHELLLGHGTGRSPRLGNICCNNIHVVAVEVPFPSQGRTNSLSDSHITISELPSELKDDQSSPISVLDPHDLEARAGPNCFKRVDADLQELRLQLQFLKSESESTSTDTEEPEIRIVEEVIQDSSAHPEVEVPEFCTYEEERDFAYVLGILTASGLQGVSMDKIFNACYLPETPVDPRVFEKLEKVFDEPEVWSRDERKVLFDLTNSALSEFLAPNIDLHPWVWSGKVVGHINNRRVFAEEVWKLLARRRKEPLRKPVLPLMDADWMDVRGVIDSIGRDVERMIRDELLDELVSDLFRHPN